MEELSLLDWLKAKFAERRMRRLVRFSWAGIVLMWSLSWLAGGHTGSGVVLLLLSLALAAWGSAVRGETATVPWPSRVEAASAGGGEIMPAPAAVLAQAAETPAVSIPLSTWAKALRLPLALALAIIGQAILIYQRENLAWGLAFYAFAVGPFAWVVWRERLLGSARPEAQPALRPIALRLWLVGIAFFAGLYAYLAAGGNRFRTDGVVMWLVSASAWLAAAWEGPVLPAGWWARVKDVWRSGTLTLRLTRGTLALVAVLAIGAYFRYAQLSAIPPEMTSDHVEKLLDVNDILQGQHKVFFERNTGREPMQFYAVVLVINLLHTGLTHLSLKLVTATAGFVTLPLIYLLGREVEDEGLGLLAALLAGIAFWPTAISRVGLRFPLTPLFVAPALFFLLRGLRRGTRNDFLMAGLCLGAGLHGYSTYRVVPLLVVAAVAWYCLPLGTAPAEREAGRPQPRGVRWQILTQTLLLLTTALIVFLPLLRYAMQEPETFWYRTLSRLSSAEASIVGSPLAIFLANQWDGLRMFNWLSDEVWVNNVTGHPALDFITGALFILGWTYLLSRLVWRRDRVAGLLLIAIPILMLPSTLNLAFPNENPSVVRAGGAIPVVFLVAAYPLWLMVKRLRASLPSPIGAWGGATAVLLVVGGAALVNYNLYFVRYPMEYARSAENASEVGQVIHDFAHSIGSYETAFVRPHPYWVDTRAVGMYAGNFGWDAAIEFEDLGRLKDDPRPELYILHPDDQATLAELRRLYPAGALSVYHSHIPNHDFLIYFAPGSPNPGDGAP